VADAVVFGALQWKVLSGHRSCDAPYDRAGGI